MPAGGIGPVRREGRRLPIPSEPEPAIRFWDSNPQISISRHQEASRKQTLEASVELLDLPTDLRYRWSAAGQAVGCSPGSDLRPGAEPELRQNALDMALYGSR